jgi:predicted metalloprotease with PDZ domain
MAKPSYRVEIEDAHAHLFRVTLTLPEPADLQCLSLPVWIPGSYLVREFSRHLSGMQARQGARSVPLRQTSKNSWQAQCSGRTALTLSYSVYAFDTSVRAAFLDAERAFFNGSSLFLRAHGREHEPHELRLGPLPRGWQVATAMPETGKLRYESGSYEELVDHPVELGRFWRGEFIAGGVPHELVVVGAQPVFDGERLLRETQRICGAQIEFWHDRAKAGKRQAKAAAPPFDRYVFLLNAVGEGYGGLEHRASTALLASRQDLPVLGQAATSDGHVRLLGLISHEYFHTWNVKRLKPAEFEALDHDQENYTELLWFFEGFTSYYDDLFLLRSGLIDAPRYLKLLSSTVSGVLAAPGRKVQSLAQASYEAWIKYYRPDENTPNATVSYYAKGALLALALDLSLRSGMTRTAQPGCSLDDVMRGLWLRSGGAAITEADVLEVVAALGGPELAGQLRHWVHGTDELPLPLLCEQVGLQWGSEAASLAQRLGLRVTEQGGQVLVKQVLQGSAAVRAGLAAGDEILACNDWRLRRLDEALLTLDAKQPRRLRLLVARDQRLVTLQLQLPLELSGQPARLTLADTGSVHALSLRRAWLGA